MSIEERFEQIYQDHFDRLFLFANTITHSRELAKDVVSDVFVELWDNKSQLSKIREIESYLFISVKNHAIRLVSKNSNALQDNNMESTVLSIDKVNPEDILLGKELFEFIEKTVSDLPDQGQLVFRMAKNNQMAYKDIAKELGISLSTVKSQLIRATSTVRTAISEKFGHKWQRDSNSGYDRIGAISLIILAYLMI